MEAEFMSGADRYLTELTALAEALSGAPADELAPDAPFLALGFDSLFLTQFAGAVQKEFGVQTSFRALLESTPTLHALANRLQAEKPFVTQEEPAPAPEAPPEKPAPASPTVPTQVLPAYDQPVAPASAPGGLAALFDAQLALMRQQIELLSGASGAATGATPALPQPAPALVSAPPSPKADPPAIPKGFGPQIGEAQEALSAAEADHLRRFIARYTARTAGSKAKVQEDRPHFADPRTAAGFNPLWKEIVYPLIVTRSEGAHLWDIDGNRYIDMLNGFGPNFFGHRAPFIIDALREQLGEGFEVGPQTPLAGEAAKLLCELTGLDRASFVNTGSEAVQAAIRIARTVTGRDKIVVFSGDYHGNFDEVLVRGVKANTGMRTVPMAPGIPFGSVENVFVCDYGEESALETIRQHAGEIAAVLVEPVQSRRPDFRPREFLHALRQLTQDHEIVLVFDEVITGFRVCPGGAQQYFDVKADLATYGKIIGGGMPIGVVAGKARFMDTFDGGYWQYGDESQPTAGVTFFAGTFVRHPFAIAAAHASLQYIKNAGPALQEGVNQKTTRLAEAMNHAFETRGLDMHVAHFASQMFIRNEEKTPLSTLFFYHLRDRGIHILENFPSYVTAAHDDAAIDTVIDAVTDALDEMIHDGVLPHRQDAGLSAWREYFPLTDEQMELWAISLESDAANCAFNESDTLSIFGPLDAGRFVSAAESALNGCEAFRLRFLPDGSGQWVDTDALLQVNVVDLSQYNADQQGEEITGYLENEANSPFDLEAGPLVRATLFRLGAQSFKFILYTHHIVFDGYSSDLLMAEIARHYSGETVEPLPDFRSFQAEIAKPVPKEKSLKYWQGLFANNVPDPLVLPGKTSGGRADFSGDTISARSDHSVLGAMEKAGRRVGVGKFAIGLSAYALLLASLSTRRDFVIGIPSAGQANSGINCIGFCVNILPLRITLEPEKTCADLMADMQQRIATAVEHWRISLHHLADALAKTGSMKSGTLVDAVFNYSTYFKGLKFGDALAEPMENPRRAVFPDLFLNVIETSEGLAFDWDYAKSAYTEKSMRTWLSAYQDILEQISRDPTRPISDFLTDHVDLAPMKTYEF